jgi:hypothetical protein
MVRSVVRRPILVLAVALVGLGSACGSSDTASSNAASPNAASPDTVAAPAASAGTEMVAVTTQPPAQVGSVGDAIEVAAGAPAMAQDAACTLDLQSLQDASEMYLALNGTLPTSQDDLIGAQLVQERSVRFEISAEGDIVPAPGSPCA